MSSGARIFVIADLGFGDAGKGLLTDFLVRRSGARLVVRYNGGAQAGHNVVVDDGRHHTFSQFGSGTFVSGVQTFLARNVVVHPTALLQEDAHLRAVGVGDALRRLRVSAEALIVTPYHQEGGRMRELARGAARHGSCGVGVGEAVGHSLAAPDDAIRAGELRNRARLRRKLMRIRDYEEREIGASLFERDIAEQWIDSAVQLSANVVEVAPALHGNVVFEGAHGVLIDQRHGFAPHTTWCDCTTAPAHELTAQCAPDAEVRSIGVLRSYAVRHGPGPFPTESAEVSNTPADHNETNAWQGEVRRGWFDAVLARKAIEACGSIDALAITHLDWLPNLVHWTYCDAYDRGPVLRRCAATEAMVIERIESAVGKPVSIGSRGPRASDVFIRTGGESWL